MEMIPLGRPTATFLLLCGLVSLASDRRALALEAVKSTDVAKTQRLTVVTASSHCDWQWGCSRAWPEDRYALIIHDVLNLMRRCPHYV